MLNRWKKITKILKGSAPQLNSIIENLDKKYKTEKFETQIIDINYNGKKGKVLQIKKANTLRYIAGQSIAGTVSFLINGDDVEYNVFGANWLDKTVLGGAGFLFLTIKTMGVVLIPVAIGAMRQVNLLKRIEKDVLASAPSEQA